MENEIEILPITLNKETLEWINALNKWYKELEEYRNNILGIPESLQGERPKQLPENK